MKEDMLAMDLVGGKQSKLGIMMPRKHKTRECRRRHAAAELLG